MRWFGSAAAAMASVLVAFGAAAADSFVGAPGLGDPYYPTDGNGGYHVRHYDLALDYDPPSHRLTGTARIDAAADQALSAFSLDYAGPEVRMVSVNNLPATFDRNGAHKLTIVPALALLPGLPFSVTVDYSGTAADTHGDGWTYANSGGAFVDGEPHGATSWYPLNDTPLNKATFTLHARVPAEWSVIANGVNTENTVLDGIRRSTWETHQPTLGYLTTVAIDKFEFLEQRRADGTPLLSAFAPAVRQLREIELRLPEALDFLESLYGPYPFDAAGGIYVDTDLKAALETQTRPVYAPWADLGTMVHEMTHQWWGDSMSVRQWSDICLNECFASYTADYLWPERKEGRDVDADYRASLDEHRDDQEFWDIALGDPGPGHEFSSVYTRGPLFLHALRLRLGDTVFFSAIRDFYTAHVYGNASLPEFRAFIQTRTAQDLGGFLAAWLDRASMPPEEFLFPPR
ncbi:M1 family peptidase [Nocardia panacis]|uniref:Aminopeptidase N n=2 Tax=Nocardia panacis TaxID=2340916 RepID=A0A3A4KRN3_9NOCA|nr:M1 family peptidase [Nocardia panacis]